MQGIKILIGCEESQAICKAFRARGLEAYSCDILPESGGHPEWHLQMDVFEAVKLHRWTLAIFHPPCTYLAVSGARWMYNQDGSINKERKDKQDAALDFVRRLMDVDIPYIAIENPISVISSKIRKPDQVIEPWMFGELEKKKTCWWLKNLPLLQGTDDVKQAMEQLPRKQQSRIHYMSPGVDRSILRSKTLPKLAEAYATQWGDYLLKI